MQSLSDEGLVQVLQQGKDGRKQEAFDCLYHRYAQKLGQYFYYSLNYDLEKARDFVHDLFVRLLEKPQLFNAQYEFKPWLYRVALNMCRNEYRRQDVENRYNQYSSINTEKYTEIDEYKDILVQGIRKLNSEQRALIALRFKIKLSVKEIAEVLDCPEGTVKSRLFYTLKELSKHYKSEENGE